MTILVSIHHQTCYEYDRMVTLGPHLVRLKPAAHCRTPIHSYSLKVEPSKHFINWQQDPFGNFVARFVFPEKIKQLQIDVGLVAEMTVINPFDFFIESYADHWPFRYAEDLAEQLLPYLKIREQGNLLKQWVDSVSLDEKHVINFLVDLNQRLQKEIRYLIRLEHGVQTCEETLSKGSGSCRDSAWLLVQILRHLGLAARFVSGYLVQLTPDVKSLEGPAGPVEDFTDLHAWTEVYVPGAGWLGLDPTSGLFAGEGHIPLSCTPDPGDSAPVAGVVDPCETQFYYHNTVQRIHEDPRVTKPYSQGQWNAITQLGERVDEELTQSDVRLTQGGEPTFVSTEDMDSAQWNTAALGKEKEIMARSLLLRLKQRFAPGAVLHHGQGKWYPGEELPRWAYSCFFRHDGESLWTHRDLLSPDEPPNAGIAEARRFVKALARQLDVDYGTIAAAYEDSFYYLHKESALPVEVDSSKTRLKDPLERRRLTRLLNQGLDETVGYVLPLAWSRENEQWYSAKWPLRKEKLILLPGDSPMGFRLPLDSLPWKVRDKSKEPVRDSFEKRSPLPSAAEIAQHYSQWKPKTQGQGIQDQAADEALDAIPHTAICIEPRDKRLWIFLPPLSHLEHWVELIGAVERAAVDCGTPVELEGYAPPNDPRLRKLAITPDPGVIEVNIHPAENWPDLVQNTQILYEEARAERLSAEKFMLDGRHTGTGGGNHVTLGAGTPEDSPFLRRPDLLASLVLFWQHHPSLSYLFSGLFVGPTSQSPRIDEARDDTLYELEIAVQQLQNQTISEPWLVDRLFRNILVDITGNTHRAEFCIDKLYNPGGPSGRLGLLEFRAFEMPPHWQMSVVQMLLLRALVACFWRQPFTSRPVRWGNDLHDRFMLPYYVEQDFKHVLWELQRMGITLDFSWFSPFFEFRFPHYGEIQKVGVKLQLHGAIEPWHVLGEEVTSQGTARFVDSSVERLQVKVEKFNNQRYCLLCNGRRVPLQKTEKPSEYVAGIRFKAWQPPFGLHPKLAAQVPLVFDLVDMANNKSVGGCTYHVSHPSGRNYERLPVNANEAEARRVARFWDHGHTADLIDVPAREENPDFPCTLDLRYNSMIRDSE